MDIKIAVLADAANITNDGKLNILGIFSAVTAPQLPAGYTHMCVVLQVAAPPGERGTNHKFTIVIIDQDGKPVVQPLEMPFQIPANLAGPEVNLHFIANMANVVFSNFGEHLVDILLDGSSRAQIRFRVQPLQFPPGMLPPGSTMPPIQ